MIIQKMDGFLPQVHSIISEGFVMKFLFIGRRGLLTSIVLQSIAKSDLLPTLVLIESEKKSIYPNLTKRVCQKYHIDFITTPSISNKEFFTKINNIQFAIVASLGEILTVDILKLVDFYNIHMGILPQYKGAFTNFYKIKKGHDRFGLTIHKMTEKIDKGEICMVKKKNFSNYIHGYHFFRENYRMAGELAVDFLNYYKKYGSSPTYVPGDSSSHYYPRMKDDDFRLNLKHTCIRNFKYINRVQFYQNPYFIEDDIKYYVYNANLLYQDEDVDYDSDYVLSIVSEKIVIVENKSGILELNTIIL